MKTTFLTMIVWFILLKKNLVETVSEKYGINVWCVCEKSNDIIFHIKNETYVSKQINLIE